MLQILVLNLLIKISFQQNFDLMLDKNQKINQIISNTDEKISTTQVLGFGLWFKWQPLALQDFSNIDPLCSEQFIFLLENQENKQTIQLLYLKNHDVGQKLNIFSEFFTLQDEISLGDYYEGIWIFFNSVFDFIQKSSTFYVFQSLSQELNKYQVGEIPIFQNVIQYQIGSTAQTNLNSCLSPFQGRLSILFEYQNFYESSFQSDIQHQYSLINDCIEYNEDIFIGSEIFDGDRYSLINLGSFEKLYFQINGWVKIIYDLSYYALYKIVQFVSYKENMSESQTILRLTYYLDQQNEFNNGIFIGSFSDTELIKKDFYQLTNIRQVQVSVFEQWHFIQLDIGYPSQAGTLKFYSNHLEEVIVLYFDLSYYTGIQYGLYIGGDLSPGNYIKGTITNLVFKTFCLPLEQEFIVKCHYTCETCFGPFSDNCLSCKSSSKRILQNNQCVCELFTFQFQEFEVCQTIDILFNNFNILEEELPCKLEGYDRCDDQIICSFGYFKYQEKYCIKCPYYNQIYSDSNILCFNCLSDPDEFQKYYNCHTDIIQQKEGSSFTYAKVARIQENFQYFEILQSKGEFYLQLKQNLISSFPNNPSCKTGFYYENEKCYQCSFGCQQCKDSILCSQCEDGYYLDKNKLCKQCINCLTCKLKMEQQICLSCPDKFYLKNEQCFLCGQFCANCRSNGFCNYCIDSQNYFISIDGINCLPCNIANCKHCYQLFFDNNLRTFYSTFNIQLENYIDANQDLDYTIHCAICQENYILDLNTNTCIYSVWSMFCLSLQFDFVNFNIQCAIQKFTSETNICNLLSNCRVCLEYNCIECTNGYYFDFLTKDCKKCPTQCGNCIQQNKKLMDNWKLDIYPMYIYLNLQEQIHSNFKEDYEIQCTSCPTNYILYNSNCIKDCNNECQNCEIIKGQATCIECKPFNDRIIRSVDKNGQCLNCQQNCELCQENSLDNPQNINKHFLLQEDNSIFTRSCFKPMQSQNRRQNFVKNFIVIDCEKFTKCKRKGIFTWNIYCDREQFDNVKQKSGFFQEGNFYQDEFFMKDILSIVELKSLIIFLNEQAIEQIDIAINFISGVTGFCHLTKSQAKISSKFIQEIFFFQGVNLKIVGKQQNVLLDNFNFTIEGFNQVQFENINFLDSTEINYQDQLLNSISFINCQLGIKMRIINIPPFNLNLINVTIESKYFDQSGSNFYFEFQSSSMKSNILIKIDGLKIIKSKFYETKFINIYTDYNPQVRCEIKNLEILDSEFHDSYLFYSSAQTGFNQMFFGNLVATNLKIGSVYLENSTLLFVPNAVLLDIDSLVIEKLKLLSNSYILFSNQLNCVNCHLNEVEIDQGYLFSNKVPLIYQKSISDKIKINFNKIIIENVLYTQEQSLLQIIQYNNYQTIVDINNFKITQVNPNQVQIDFIEQEKSLIHISCQQCYINQIEIHRQSGLPEISIINSKQIIISNSLFIQNVKQAENIFVDCKKNIQNQFSYFLYFGQYVNVKIDNLTIIDAISLNFPFIIIQGIQAMQQNFEESIEIINSKFENNKLITSASNSPTSIIYIKTEQKCFIKLTNLQFNQNHLNIKVQDLMTHSSSTLLIDTQIGKIILTNSLFQQNLISNSSDSILFIKGQVVEIIQSKFIKNNILNFSNIINRIQQNKISNKLSDYDLQQIIKVLSNGGNGYILTKQFSLKNCSVQESYSLNGGAFYIDTFGDTSILIENSNFTETSSSLFDSASSAGGCFYIDAQVSTLTLQVKNSIFNQSFSRSKGGCFFIQPSISYNQVIFEQIKIINSFSTTSQFFDFSLQNLQNVLSNITFFNVQIVYDKIVFNLFLGLLENVSSDEATTLLNNDPIIKVKYGNVTIHTVDCKFQSKFFLIAIDQGQIINLIQITLENGFIRNSPFMSLNLKSGSQGLLNIQNLKMNNIQEFLELKEQQKCQRKSNKNLLEQFCISPLSVNNHNILVNDIEITQQITLCENQNLIIKSEKNMFSLIMISNINNNHKIIIQEMFFNEIICKYCENGLLSLTNIEEKNEDNIILNRIIVQNSQCGITGCMTLINKNSSNFLKTNYRVLQQQNWEQLKSSFNFQVSISNSKFFKNMAVYGGAICVIDIDILINQCQFFQNQAKIGGAIYSYTSQEQNYKTIIFASFLIDNQAELAANIYLENQMLQQTQKVNIFMEKNSSTLSGVVFERPRSLVLAINQGTLFLQKKIVSFTSSKVVEQTIIQPYKLLGFQEKVKTLFFPSGQMISQYYYFDISTSTNIPYNLSFRIIGLNMLNQREDYLNGSVCTLKHKVINLTDLVEINDSQAKLSIYSTTFNISSLDFNLDDLIVYFNPYYAKEIVLRLFISCDMIEIPIYDENPPFLIKNYITDYELLVDIKTFPCQLGEYFNSTSEICIKCNSNQSQYQVEQNSTLCSIKDESKINSVESEKIQLKPNYWRAYFYSTKIEVCYHLQWNCLGGWHPGDKSCTLGHIGALCEQCDLYNIRGDGYFSISSPYKCSNCALIEGNIITITLVSLWTLISILMSVNSTIDTIKKFSAGSKLVLFGVSSLFKQSSTAVLIKVFTNYLQIIQTISTFQLQVPSELTIIFNSVGNPIEQVGYSLDCFLMSISDISIIYFRIIWSFLMNISYVLTFFILLVLGVQLKLIKFNILMITTALTYIFIFLQPNIIQSLISLISFRTLSNIDWVQGNVAYRYDTKSHQYWMITFCLPILITFSLLIPFYMFYCIRKNENNLEEVKTRETWGYLYNEYKLKAYYWEFIKIFQKEFIIIFLAYYEDYIAIKAALVFLVIFAYSFMSTSVSPYMTGELNRFDTQSTTVCAVSIILGSSIYTAQNQNFIEIVYPFYIIIALINGWFLIKMIINILFAYFDKLHEQIDKVKEIISKKFPDYLLKYPQVQKLLESKQKKLERIQLRFALVKQYLMPIAKKILEVKNQAEPKKNTSKVQNIEQEHQIACTKMNNYTKLNSVNFIQTHKIFPISQRSLNSSQN